jgi:hypothetical protein
MDSSLPSPLPSPACGRGDELVLVDREPRSAASPQNLIFTDSLDRSAGPWNTASTLFPSGSRRNAA